MNKNVFYQLKKTIDLCMQQWIDLDEKRQNDVSDTSFCLVESGGLEPPTFRV